ncbi:cytochrome P450 [Nannocystaceae bacterium ST9]
MARMAVALQTLPRPRALPFVGALPTLLTQQFAALDRWQRELGGVIEVPFGPTSFVLLTEADVAHEMLVDKARNFVRGGPAWDSLATVFGNGLVGSEGELWRERRRMIQPHLHHDAIRQLISSMSSAIDEVCELWSKRARSDRPIDLQHEVAQITMAVILRVLFGTHMSDDDYQRAAVSLRHAVDSIAVGWLTFKLPAWVPVPGRDRFRRAIADVDRMVSELAEQRRASKRYTDDLLGILVGLHEQGALDAKGLRDEAVSLFVAGYETTANTLGFAFWELAKRPELCAELRSEAASLPSSEAIDLASVAQLTRADQVFRESLRMYPGALWLPRIALEDDTLGGLPIRKGTTAVVSLYSVHRDPKAWDQPDQFRPERHTRANHDRHAWMPFGLGQHMCVGQRLALAEGPLILARLAQRFDYEALADRSPKMRMSTALKSANGIWVRSNPR